MCKYGAKVFVSLGAMLWLAALPARAEDLRVFSYNVWGIFGAKYRPERMAAIAGQIAELDPDVVVLAEAFEEAHRAVLLQGLRERGFPLETARYYPNGGYGSGVMVLSKYPVVDDRFQGFRVYVPAGRGEEKMGKGMASLRLRAPEGDVLVIGLHALSRAMLPRLFGRVVQTDARKCSRLLEMFEIARLVQERQAQTGARAVIVAGDFNVSPELLEYQLLLALSGLKNSFDQLHPGENPPTFSWQNPFVFPHVPDIDQRIDHILYRNFESGQGPGLIPRESRVVMKETFALPSGEKIHFSDHYGMFTRFELDGVAEGPGLMALSPGISGAEAAGLCPRLRRGARLEEDRELWTRLALAILAQADENVVFKSRGVKAAAKVLVDLEGTGGFPLHYRDRQALKRSLAQRSRQ